MTTPAPVFQAARRQRTPLTVDLSEGVIQAGGHRARFDPTADDAIELAYLRLVRRMRDVHREPSFVLRSDDVEALAAVLRRDAVTVLDRLGELMGATVTQRRSMVSAFLAGALLIAVATSAVALGADDGPASTPVAPAAGEQLAPDADLRSPPAVDDAVAGDAVAEDTGVDAVVVDDEVVDAAAPSQPPADGAAPSASAADGPPVAVAPPSSSPSPAATADRPAVRSERGPASGSPGAGGPEPVDPPAPAEPPAPADPPAPARPDAPAPVDGEPDTWTWDDPVVDQPGAVIDIPSEPEDGEPGSDVDLPGDDPVPGAA